MECIHKLNTLSMRRPVGASPITVSRCAARGKCVQNASDVALLRIPNLAACEGCPQKAPRVLEQPIEKPVLARLSNIDPRSLFERVVVINLTRRADRRREMEAEFSKGWPFVEPVFQKAIDGQQCKPPQGYLHGDYAWACFQSHRRAIEDAINDGVNSVLILEDDALLCPDFSARAIRFANDLPLDWDFAWLGGHHMQPPTPVKPGIVRSVHMDRCHAYAVRGTALRELYRYWHQWHTGHCDWAISEWVKPLNSYCASPWLVGQRGGFSDIKFEQKGQEWWHEPQHGVPVPMDRTAEILAKLPCQFRSTFKHTKGHGVPCVGCTLTGNRTGEATLWRYAEDQPEPICNLCNDRVAPEPIAKSIPVRFRARLGLTTFSVFRDDRQLSSPKASAPRLAKF